MASNPTIASSFGFNHSMRIYFFLHLLEGKSPFVLPLANWAGPEPSSGPEPPWHEAPMRPMRWWQLLSIYIILIYLFIYLQYLLFSL